MTSKLQAARREADRAFAVSLGIDPNELHHATQAIWSNLNPQRTGRDIAQSAAAAALWAIKQMKEKTHMTDAQRSALKDICKRYNVPFDEGKYTSQFDLPDGWVAGPVDTIWVGVDPAGRIHS